MQFIIEVNTENQTNLVVFNRKVGFMKLIREITAEEENFRLEKNFIKRDPVKVVEEDQILLIPFKITGFTQDCDGSLMLKLSALQIDTLEETGWTEQNIGIYPSTGFITNENELKSLYKTTLENNLENMTKEQKHKLSISLQDIANKETAKRRFMGPNLFTKNNEV